MSDVSRARESVYGADHTSLQTQNRDLSRAWAVGRDPMASSIPLDRSDIRVTTTHTLPRATYRPEVPYSYSSP